MRLKPLRDQTLVVTGATSGNGLAITEEAVRRGARVLAVGRDVAALAALKARLGGDGGRVATHAVDVASEGAAESISDAAIEAFAPHEAIAAVWELVDALNGYITEQEPWALAKDEAERERLGTVLHVAAQCVNDCNTLLSPFLPHSANKVHAVLGGAGDFMPMPRIEQVDDPERVLRAVGAARSLLPVELYDNGAQHVVVTPEGDELATLRPDREAIAELGVTGVNCVAAVGEGWRNRMFWANGEDPATGSAAGPIACHLARHGLIAWGEEIVIAQGVEMGRPSALHARADGGEGLIDAVEVGGAAVVVARGEVRL